MKDIDLLEQRERARAAKRQKDLALRQLHERALAALLDPTRAPTVRQQARDRVLLWEARQLCSPRYIEAWRRILALPAAEMAGAMLRDDAEGVALRQNTPFGFLATRSAAA